MGQGADLRVRGAVSVRTDAGEVARELADAIADRDAAVALVFASPAHQLGPLCHALAGALGSTPVVGARAAGTLGPGGFAGDAVAVVSLGGPAVRVSVQHVPWAELGGCAAGEQAMHQGLRRLGGDPLAPLPDRHLGIALLDGSCHQEELVCAGFASAAPGVQLVGASAPGRAGVFVDGDCREGVAALVVVDCATRFATVVEHDVTPGPERLVVTAADDRRVHELDGKPAGAVYRELCRCAELTPACLAQSPLAAVIGGVTYPRSVWRVDGESLWMLGAVGVGTVLRSATVGDGLASSERAVARLRGEVGGDLAGLLGFHCLGRFRQVVAAGTDRQIGQVLARPAGFGMQGMGVQHNAVHLNHSLTAVGFGGTAPGDG